MIRYRGRMSPVPNLTYYCFGALMNEIKAVLKQ